MPSPTREEWLGLCLRSESEQPHEWPYLGWAIRNRVESSRFPATYQDVICQPRQFSYFNPFTHIADPNAIYDAAIRGYAGDTSGWPHNDLPYAIECAAWVVNASMWESPFRSRVFYFWAPQSMNPPGSDPAWAKNLSRIFTPSCIDPWRWKFGEE